MILSEEVVIKLNSRNIKHYRDFGYEICNKPYGKSILVKVDDLSKGSNIIINVECDYCYITKEVSYREYNRNISHNNKFSCSNKCGSLKKKEISIYKYGVESPSMLEDIKNKNKKTCLGKYGEEYYMLTNDFKEKSEKTMLKRYGTNNPMHSQVIRDRFKETILNEYGVENIFQSELIREKIKETNLERYGVGFYSQTEDYNIKIKETNLERYGVEFYSQTEDYKVKVKKTNLERYGVVYYMLTEDFKRKSKETNLEKYGNEYVSQSELFRVNNNVNCTDFYIKYMGNKISLYKCDNNSNHTFELSSDNYHARVKNNTPLCTLCNPIGDSKSIKEKDLYKYIKDNYNGEIISGYRDGLEIDIYLPELKIGFEFNGLYWHSEKFKKKNYHLDKTNYFKERGIRIIHIWEDDWIFKQNIVKSQINNLLKNNSNNIFARKCLVKLVSIKETRTFLDDNHIQGFVSSKIKLGLYYNNELVSIMTFDQSEGRKKMEEGYNLSRFCNKLNINVIGGASKLLKYFIKIYGVKRIVSYADKDWSIGSLYYTLGFENIKESKPDYKYIVDNKRVHKSRYKKSRLSTTLTESAIMKLNNINRIYDCGKIKFEYKKREL